MRGGGCAGSSHSSCASISSLCRPVLLIDEAQESGVPVLSELRLLASAELDSRSILMVVLAGDRRLGVKLDSPELLPLASRIRSRLRPETLSAHQLADCLSHVLKLAGNPKLMSTALVQTLCEHAARNQKGHSFIFAFMGGSCSAITIIKE